MPVIFDQVVGRVEEPAPSEAVTNKRETAPLASELNQKLAAIARHQKTRAARIKAN